MILVDKQIRSLCKEKNMIVPFEEDFLQSESYDLSIGDMVYIADKNLRELDLKNEDALNKLYKEYNIPDEGFLLKSKECILISLKEILNIPENINAHIRPRTRFIRAGLEISTQQLNSTYHGILKIRLSNFLDVPIRIYKGLKICQIIFEELKEIPTKEKQYKNKKDATYQNEKEFRGPKLDPELQKKADEIVRQLLGD
jgi:dCTP deaminase